MRVQVASPHLGPYIAVQQAEYAAMEYTSCLALIAITHPSSSWITDRDIKYLQAQLNRRPSGPTYLDEFPSLLLSPTSLSAMFKPSLVVSLLAVSALATFPSVNEIKFDRDTVVNTNWENVLKTGDVLGFSRIFRDLEHRQGPTCVDSGYGRCNNNTGNCCPSTGVCCIVNNYDIVGQSSRHLITAPALIEQS